MTPQPDFAAFYSIFKIFIQGENPYDYSLLSQMLSNEHGISGDWIFGYPPWFLLFLSPFCFFDFQTASILWTIFNCALLIVLYALLETIAKYYCDTPRTAFLLIPIFLPFAQVLVWGQVGIIMAVIVTATIYTILKQKDFLAGCLLFLLTLKIQLSFLLLLYASCLILKEHRFRIVWGGLFSFTISAISLLFISPPIISHWLASYSYTVPYIEPLFNPTVTDWIKFLALSLNISPPKYFDFLPTMLCAIAVPLSYYYSKTFRNPFFAIPLLCTASLITTPYAWFHDQAILAFAFLLPFMLPQISPRIRQVLLVSQAILLIQNLYPDRFEILTVFWFPIFMFAVWWITMHHVQTIQKQTTA